MSFGTILEGSLLDLVFNDIPYVLGPPFGGIYIALWIGNPGEMGTMGNEVSGGGYEREDAHGLWTMASGSPLQVSNNTALVFPEATSDWGYVTHFGIFDVASGAGLLAYGPLQGAPINIVQGSIPRFAVGTIVIQLD